MNLKKRRSIFRSKKSLDTVDFDMLLGKLNHYGFRGITDKLLRNYLTNKKKYVSLRKILVISEKNLMWCTSRVGFRTNTLFTIFKGPS